MTELDFDELDKAVNNLMADVNASRQPKSTEPTDDIVATIIPPKPAVDTAATTPSESVAEGNAIPEARQSQQVDQPAVARPLAVKRRGRFMDVVHPSSDMKTTTPSVPKREGATIAPPEGVMPVTPTLTEEPDTTNASNFDFAASFDMESTKQGVEQPSVESTNTEPEIKNEWPDPIEYTQARDQQASDGDSQNLPSSDVPAEIVAEVAAPATEKPLISPFLADAKVEKRPLGGQAVSLTDEQPTANDEQVTPEPATLPDELRTDVMSLESTSTHTEAGGEPMADDGQQAEVPITPVDSEPQTATSEPAAAAQPSVGGSIAQQYAEQPSTSDQTSGAIYDTAAYHQPLEHPEVHKSGWTWIIWILLLLIAGAAAGAVYFYFTTQA